MNVSLNFGGSGWVWAGDWVEPRDRNQTLLSSSFVVAGPQRVDQELSTEATINPRDVPRSCPAIKPEDRLIAVVAGIERDVVIDPESLVDITDRADGRRIAWEAPEGTWRAMAFWATFPDESTTVNHIDKEAMGRYVEYLGKKYVDAVGDEFGKTIDSLFGDSFEVPVHRNGIYWSDALPAQFESRKGYTLITHLPGLWWEVGEISPKIRYDVNHVLHAVGIDAFFDTFTSWCTAHGIQSRVQPYGFVTDNIEGAGAVDLPEMEITAGEKDAVPWFDTRIGPKKYVASGAHVYGRNMVTTEAYTYMHWEPYRATLEELKIASDNFLRAGANKFYNHGYIASPERDIAPTRGFYAAIHVSHDNTWWRYYHHLSDYIARACYMLRQGTFHADIAVYSPLANQWTLDAFNARRWTRGFEWGELGRLLLSNGYDFDLVNDEVLQNIASFNGQTLEIGDMRYSVLILPNIEAMPVETLRRIEQYAQQGGAVIALERLPVASCGLEDYEARDAEVREAAAGMFEAPVGRDDTEEHSYGTGTTYWLKTVMDRSDVLERRSSALDPFLKVLRKTIAPDMAIDFLRYDLRENDGLAFTHRKSRDRDIYFVTNIQDRPVDMDVTFRVHDATPFDWNPYTGEIRELGLYRHEQQGTVVPVRLPAYGSTFLVFASGPPRPHLISSDFENIYREANGRLVGETRRAGLHRMKLPPSDHPRNIPPGVDETQRQRILQTPMVTEVSDVPPPLLISGSWHVQFLGEQRSAQTIPLTGLKSWTELDEWKHFSGTARYTVNPFNLAEAYRADGMVLRLSLGDLGGVAQVTINNKDAGTVWMRGQELDVTPYVTVGSNTIVVDVTNTLINRVSGMSSFPPVPEALQPRLGQGLDDGHSSAEALKGFEPLPRSGLLGPVEIRPSKCLSMPEFVP